MGIVRKFKGMIRKNKEEEDDREKYAPVEYRIFQRFVLFMSGPALVSAILCILFNSSVYFLMLGLCAGSLLCGNYIFDRCMKIKIKEAKAKL